jgi:hypothetical protein
LPDLKVDTVQHRTVAERDRRAADVDDRRGHVQPFASSSAPRLARMSVK